jgi:hypothetical protein
MSSGGGSIPPLALALIASAIVSTTAIQADEGYYAPRTDWASYWEGDLNISVFVFRDMNRNGLYDLPDHPMSGIMVDGMGLGRPIWAASNGAGFANFAMSGTKSDATIMFEGSYDFSVRVPPRWLVTTGNASQTVQFELKPGSPADMVAVPAPALVGLAPELWLSGQLPASLDGQTVVLTGPDRTGHPLSPTEARRFEFEAGVGTWTSSTKPALGLDLGDTPIQIAQAWWTSAGSSQASRTVTFDDLQSEGVLKVPSGYAGLGWDNFVMTHRKFYDPEGYRNGVMSGEFLAYNGSGHPAAISSEKPFDFIGGYFSISTLDAQGETLAVTGWRGAELVYEEEMTLSALGPTYLAAQFEAVTRLEFRTEHYWQFTADDLVFALP